jgi:transcriptional regulator GlxA family with amidase domain
MTNAQRIPPTPRIVEILTFPDVQLLDVAGPLQVFASTNEWAIAAGRPTPYRIRVVARRTPVTTNSGLAISAAALPAATDPLDTLVVAGGFGVHAACADARLLQWLERGATRARRVVSICTGAFLLGAVGLLQGRRAVTHWSQCGELASRHRGAQVEVDPIYVRDGRVWSSAGVTAGIDLTLALVEEDLGHAAAIAVARELVVFLKRPGGQSQFSRALDFQHRDEGFEQLHGWMTGHLAGDLSVPALAARMAMTERTFLRRYRSATGMTPARAVERLRVESAQQLLSGSALPLKRIARRCGFGSDETMRKSFQRQLSISPSDFRARFSRSSR